MLFVEENWRASAPLAKLLSFVRLEKARAENISRDASSSASFAAHARSIWPRELPLAFWLRGGKGPAPGTAFVPVDMRKHSQKTGPTFGEDKKRKVMCSKTHWSDFGGPALDAPFFDNPDGNVPAIRGFYFSKE
jgi:hypothetical protein